jgi:trimeric autotransporter adhesin
VGGIIPEIVVPSEDPRITLHSEEETQMNQMTGRNVLIGFFMVAVLTAAASCGGGSGVGTTTFPGVVRSATLTGAQENPSNTSTATGRGAVIVDQTTRGITGGITFSGLVNVSGHHIHQAPAGQPTQNGVVIVTLTLSPDGFSATIPAGTILTPAQYTALLAGELYFNVHTSGFVDGEIRGQINVHGGVTAGLASLNGAQEGSGNTSTATGRGTIVFDSTTRQVLISYVTHNVSNSTVAHIHSGAPGVSGPANVVSLLQGTNIYTAPNPTILTVQNVTDLNAGNTYFNIHSTNTNCPPAANCAAGEIRGQIAVQ